MKINYKINKYIIAWELLFSASFCEEVQVIKMRLYKNHPDEYLKLKADYKEILLSGDNYIPDYDLIYDEVFASKIFNKLYKETERFYKELVKVYDKYKKVLDEELYSILRFNLPSEINLYTVPPVMKLQRYFDLEEEKIIIWGTEGKEDISNLCNIIKVVVENNIELASEKKPLATKIIDLAIHGELATRLSNKSQYRAANFNVCKDLYPYFLMYMGILEDEKFLSYMMRDQIAFEIENYQMEHKLQKVDLKSFIDFCYNNWNHLVKL